MPASHRQTKNRKPAGKLVVRDRRLVGLPGQRREAIPGKQSGKKSWRVRHGSEDSRA